MNVVDSSAWLSCFDADFKGLESVQFHPKAQLA